MQVFIPLISSIEVNKTNADTYAYKYGYIIYQVFISNIPSFSEKMYISTFFFFSLRLTIQVLIHMRSSMDI